MIEHTLSVGRFQLRGCAFHCAEWMMKKPEWFKFTRCEPQTCGRLTPEDVIGFHQRAWYLTIWRVVFGVTYRRYFPTRIDGVPQ